ncbi:MAG: class I SAM-dependent methyltransferase [Candidatus Methanoperedenaceae archaeon]|nr:class I SAM-dependent methyltransferase [Candidatus Methanoperedenaceae archaeon]
MSKAELYYEKNRQYFSYIRGDIIDLISVGNHRILDVGCGEGRTLRQLKELGKAKETIGIEINENMANRLAQNVDKMIIGDVENLELDFEKEFFDYIIFGDILEHLRNPIKILKEYSEYLKNDGYIIASIPNLNHYGVVIPLIFFDKFEYKMAGILDKTHLRFFTRKSILKLFNSSGFELITIKSNKKSFIVAIFTFITFGILNRFFVYQYFIKARKKI